MSAVFDIGFNFSVFDAGTTSSSKSWLTELKENLIPKIEALLGRELQVLNIQSRNSLDRFEEFYWEELKQAKAIISVLSFKSVRSDKFTVELEELSKELHNENSSKKIFPVLRQPVPEELIPLVLSTVKRYSFYKKEEESNSIVELSPSNYNNTSSEYNELLELLATDIAKFLDKDTVQSNNTWLDEKSTENNLKIYLAEVADDQLVARETIRRELIKLGYTILPKTSLVQRMPACQMEINRYMQQCDLAIHLLGGIYGMVPEGSARSIAEIQNDISEEFSADNGLIKIIWIPDNVKLTDERQKLLVEDIRTSIKSENTTLLQGEITELQSLLPSKLAEAKNLLNSKKIEMNESESKPNKVYLITDAADTVKVQEVFKICKIEGCEVLQVDPNVDESEIRKAHTRSLQSCDAVILYFASGSTNWLQSRSRDLLRATSYGRANKSMPKLIVRGREKSAIQLKSKDFDLIAESSQDFSLELKNWIESWKN
jgi:hypothetical protein